MHARLARRVGAAIFCTLALACGGDDGGGSPSAADGGSPSHADAGAGCNGLTYATFGRSFVGKYCSSCHAATVKGDARQGAPDSYVFDTVAQVRTHADDMKMDVVVTKVMPFGLSAPKPSDAERVQFGQWLSCGAPE